MAAGSTYTPIATTTASGSVSSITFTGISGSYTDILLVCNAYYTTSSRTSFSIQVGNGLIDTGTNYSWTGLYGNGTTAASGRATSQTYTYGGVISGVPCTFLVHLLNYSNTTTYKTFLTRGNSLGSSASEDVWAGANLWRSTSAINQVKVYVGNGSNFTSDSVFTLYGITAA